MRDRLFFVLCVAVGIGALVASTAYSAWSPGEHIVMLVASVVLMGGGFIGALVSD